MKTAQELKKISEGTVTKYLDSDGDLVDEDQADTFSSEREAQRAIDKYEGPGETNIVDYGGGEFIIEVEVDEEDLDDMGSDEPDVLKRLGKMLSNFIDSGSYMKPYQQYSGRGMYGDKCFGITVSRGDYQTMFRKLEKSIPGTRSDNMGMDMIIYWPQIQYKEIEKYLPDFDDEE